MNSFYWQAPKPPIVAEPFSNFIEVYVVESESIYKARYTVALSDEGKWSCSCPHWVFRRPEEGCKHIERVVIWKRLNPQIVVPINPNLVKRFSVMDV